MCRLPWVGQSATDNFDRWTQFALILLGEPDLPLWTNRPEPLVAQHPPTLTLGTGSFAVNVQAGGSPVDSARVTLWALSQDYKSGYTNPSGQVNLPFDPETTGTFLLTAGRRNHRPYETTVPVGPAGPFVYAQGVSIDDDNAGGAWERRWAGTSARRMAHRPQEPGGATATQVSATLTVEAGRSVRWDLHRRTHLFDIQPGQCSRAAATW
jgi:hypothetical protein